MTLRRVLLNSTVVTVAFLLMSLSATASDTSRVLTRDAFLSIVKKYHPVALQASLGVDKANAALISSRGAFDPVVNADLSRKTLDGDLYYNYFSPQLVVPTWYGIELKAGVEEIVGNHVSRESTLGQTSFAGVKIKTNSIIYDSRRATLQQAKAMVGMSKADQSTILNNLLLESLTAYYDWVASHQNYKVIANTLSIAEQRLKFVRTAYNQGAKPAIDTTEALAQLQNVYTMYNDAYLTYINAGVELSNYLWHENNIAVDWDSTIVPDVSTIELLPQDEIKPIGHFLAQLPDHPKLQSISYKIESLNIERRLKAQYLIPEISISANMLNKGYEVSRIDAPFLENNHKVGVSLNMPLLFREARGNYAQAKIKVQDANIYRSNTTRQLENKVMKHYNEVQNLAVQVSNYTQVYNNYIRLYRGERTRFDIGESSLFLLNSRENKMLEAAQKLLKLKAKWNKAYAKLYWASGLLQ